MATGESKRPVINNPKLIKEMESMKAKLGIDTDTELVSRALSLLQICLELQDEGFLIGGFTEKNEVADFRYRTITLRTV